MILVSGTKRSGTSMWMQILAAAGIPWVGERFSGAWEEAIGAANPRGFYESKLRQGIFYATNPNPQTGAWLAPDRTRDHAVKVFLPGVVRTDLAYLDKVIVTLRPWHQVSASLAHLYALEDAHHDTLPDDRRARARGAVARGRPKVPHEVEWWLDHYELLRDVAVRRYPIHVVSYQRVLDDPRREVGRVLTWLGQGDLDKAVGAIDRTLYRQADAPRPDSPVDDDILDLMDQLYATFHEERPLGQDLIEAINDAHHRIVEQFGRPSRDRHRDDPEVDGTGEAPTG